MNEVINRLRTIQSNLQEAQSIGRKENVAVSIMQLLSDAEMQVERTIKRVSKERLARLAMAREIRWAKKREPKAPKAEAPTNGRRRRKSTK